MPKGRRTAFEAFGNYIRDEVKERTSDESVTARAAQAAARASAEPSELPLVGADDSSAGGLDGVSSEVQEVADEAAVPTPSGAPARDSDPVARLSYIRGEIKRLTDSLAELAIEEQALEAYVEVLEGKRPKR